MTEQRKEAIRRSFAESIDRDVGSAADFVAEAAIAPVVLEINNVCLLVGGVEERGRVKIPGFSHNLREAEIGADFIPLLSDTVDVLAGVKSGLSCWKEGVAATIALEKRMPDTIGHVVKRHLLAKPSSIVDAAADFYNGQLVDLLQKVSAIVPGFVATVWGIHVTKRDVIFETGPLHAEIESLSEINPLRGRLLETSERVARSSAAVRDSLLSLYVEVTQNFGRPRERDIDFSL